MPKNRVEPKPHPVAVLPLRSVTDQVVVDLLREIAQGRESRAAVLIPPVVDADEDRTTEHGLSRHKTRAEVDRLTLLLSVAVRPQHHVVPDDDGNHLAVSRTDAVVERVDDVHVVHDLALVGGDAGVRVNADADDGLNEIRNGIHD